MKCPACHTHNHVDPTSLGGIARCKKCGMRLSAARVETPREHPVMDNDGLGIHPALARKLRARGEVAPQTGQKNTANSGVVSGMDAMDQNDSLNKTKVLNSSPQRQKNERRRKTAAQRQAELEAELKALPPIPGYEITGIIGKGAMGRVFKGKRIADGLIIAIKILAPELALREDFIARFAREAAAVRAIKHPGVVSILERGMVDQIHYFTMPYVRGVSLRRLIAKKSFRPLRAIRYARQICKVLSAAHEKHVVHRDLKPENIIVTKEEQLVLLDFGLADMGEDDPHPNLTKSRMTMGTVNYMAPEQRTDAKRVGPPADLYALGVILYEMLTGDLPLGRFKLPTERPELKQLPKRIDVCLSRVLDRDPEKRYSSAAELDLELEKIEKFLMHQFDDTIVTSKQPFPARNSEQRVKSSQATEIREKFKTLREKSKSNPVIQKDFPAELSLMDHEKEVLSEQNPSLYSKPPEWITSPPWVRHPILLWGVVAVVLGIIVGGIVALQEEPLQDTVDERSEK